MKGKRNRKIFNLTIEISFFIPLTLEVFSSISAKQAVKKTKQQEQDEELEKASRRKQ